MARLIARIRDASSAFGILLDSLNKDYAVNRIQRPLDGMARLIEIYVSGYTVNRIQRPLDGMAKLIADEFCGAYRGIHRLVCGFFYKSRSNAQRARPCQSTR